MIKLEDYNTLRKIGSGGMGDVYLAEHEKLEKKVAIKSLHKNLATDNSFRERFSQEAKTHSKLDHPNIVRLLDYKESKDGLFLIMEYVDGKQLDEHIKKVTGPIPEKELTALFTQVLDAIGYAHEEGLVHRDIKPSNIMIDKKGRIKVLDFGIAKMQEEEKGLTKTGMQIGTAAYMSPEQVNAKKVDKLTDIYSLGVTLFYMAVGKSPYDEETNTFLIQTKIVSEPFPIASKVYPGVSERFEQIIQKATQKNKKDRYKSCEEFKKDLYATSISNSKNIVKEKQTESNFWHITKDNYFFKFLKILGLFCLGILGPFFFTEIYDPITLYVGDKFWHSSELTGRFVKYWTLLFLFAGSIEPYIFLGQILSFLPLLVYTSGGYIIRILKNIKWIWAYIIVFILTGPLIYLFDGWFDFEDMLEELFGGGLIFAGFLGLVPVFLFHMYQKMGLPSRKWKVAYIIAFILTGPLIYLFDGWFDFEDMLEYLFKDGFIFAGFLGLVPVFLFHMYLKVKERSKVYKNGKVLDQLKKLNDLKKEGVITKAEYERLSKELKKDF